MIAGGHVGTTPGGLTAGTVFTFRESWPLLGPLWATRVPGVHYVSLGVTPSGTCVRYFDTARGTYGQILTDDYVMRNVRVIGRPDEGADED